MPVGGSRHYGGPGLGAIGVWDCVSCGAENTGPLEQGCVLCGAGKPGVHGAPPPPPPAASAPVRESAPPVAGAPPAASAAQPSIEERLQDYAKRWAQEHPEALLEDAFVAGYVAGVTNVSRHRGVTPPTAPQAQPILFRPEGLVNRTIIAALELFRDQVLVTAREEIAAGEWMTVEAVNQLLAQLRTYEQQQEAEAAHA